MTKNQFRALNILSIGLSILGGGYDHFFGADAVTEQLLDIYTKIEPELTGVLMLLVAGLGFIGLAAMLVSSVGLMFFWNFSRHIYAASFALNLPLLPFMGTHIASGINQMLYDLGVVVASVILALIYYSPVREYFVSKPNIAFERDAPKAARPSTLR